MNLTLKLHQVIAVDIDTAFSLWTEPEHLVSWFGPEGVNCIAAKVDLRIGGLYQLTMRMEDGSQLTISGLYYDIVRPSLLKFSWQVNDAEQEEQVFVKFVAKGTETEIIVIHQKIASEAVKDRHRHGWLGCFDKLLRIHDRDS